MTIGIEKSKLSSLFKLEDKWIIRHEDGYCIAFNPKKGEVKRITEKDIQSYSDATVIKNDLLENSLTAPLKLYIDLTRKCNLRCKHCLSASGDSLDELTYETVSDILRWAKKNGVMRVKFGGGEPIMHPRFWDIVSEANNAGLAVSISSNGVLISKEVAEALAYLQVKTSISLDGFEGKHDQIRGQGVFEAAIEALKKLKEAGAKAAIRCTLIDSPTFSNIEDIPKLLDIAESVGVSLKVIRAKPCGRAQANSLGLTSPGESYWGLLRWLKVQKELGRKVEFEGIMDLCNDGEERIFGNFFDCGAGSRDLRIGPDGVVSPCAFLEEYFNCGVVKSAADLEKIWRESPALKKIREISSTPNTECANCFRKNTCGGECRAMVMAVSDQANGVDPCCPKEYFGEEILKNNTFETAVETVC